MAEALVVVDGSNFFVSSPSRDVEPGADASGYFFADMRHLSPWQLLADGEPLTVLSSGTVDYYSASIHATLARAQVGKNPTVTINTYFVLCYCGLIVPVVGVGVASEFFADFAAVVAFSILLAALSVLSLIRIPWDLSRGSAAA